MRFFPPFAALAAVLSTTVPAAAGPFSSFGFGDHPFGYPVLCLTDRQIRDYFHALGYADVKLNVPNEQLIQVRVVDQGRVTLFRFNFCTQRIVGVETL